MSTAIAGGSQRADTKHHHVCPWWLGYFLVSPLRRLIERPERLLAPYVRPGMAVLEIGCGMGFFTLPVARMVGDAGRVLCVDVQPRMLAALGRRARRAGLSQRIQTRHCAAESLGLAEHAGGFDLALLIHVLHELPNAATALAEVRAALKPQGQLVLIEPPGHVSLSDFESQLEAARGAGLAIASRWPQTRHHAALLRCAT